MVCFGSTKCLEGNTGSLSIFLRTLVVPHFFSEYLTCRRLHRPIYENHDGVGMVKK